MCLPFVNILNNSCPHEYRTESITVTLLFTTIQNYGAEISSEFTTYLYLDSDIIKTDCVLTMYAELKIIICHRFIFQPTSAYDVPIW